MREAEKELQCATHCLFRYLQHAVGPQTWKQNIKVKWWRNDMEMFSVLLALCEGNPVITSCFPKQRARKNEDFDLLAEQTSSLKQIWNRWF